MDDRLELRPAAMLKPRIDEDFVGELLPAAWLASVRKVGIAVGRAPQPGEPEQPLLAVDGDFVVGHAGE